MTLNKIVLLGPSHIKRLEHYIEHNILESPFRNLDLFGHGGAPIWHPIFDEFLERRISSYDSIFILVGDFRFGNNFLSHPETPENHYGIEKSLISIENDRKMYKKCINYISSLVSKYDDRIKLIFWDLAYRELLNKKNSKYIFNNSYHHPVWNLKDVESLFSANTISLCSLLDLSAFQMYIDNSGHPSFLGWHYIFMLMTKTGTLVNENLLNKRWIDEKTCLSKLLVSPSQQNLKKVLIIGRSVFTKNIINLKERGLLEDCRCVFEPSLSEVAFLAKENPRTHIVFCSPMTFAWPDDAQEDHIRKLIDLKSQFKNLRFLFWELFAGCVISKRDKRYIGLGPRPNILNNHLKIEQKFRRSVVKLSKIPPSECDGYVDIGENMQPTILAIFEILNALILDESKIMRSFNRLRITEILLSQQ